MDQRSDRAVQRDDEFLTALSRGIDPTGGQDELAALLLTLRDDVEADMPPAPMLQDSAPGVGESTEEMNVVSLDSRRRRGSHRRDAARAERSGMSPWLSGIIGAAAATVVVAGTGAALYNATPGSALWGPSQAVFGDSPDMVQFASDLDEIETKAENGDIDGARALIEGLRAKLSADRAGRDRQAGEEAAKQPAQTETVTVTAEPKKDNDKRPETVTVTPEPETHTVTVTEQAPNQNSGAPHDGNPPAPMTPSSSSAPSTTQQPQQPQQQ